MSEPQNLIGWWAPWLGVVVIGVGNYLFLSAPRLLLWLWVVLYAAWIGQVIGDALFGGYLSGFFGGLAMTPVAYWVDRQRAGPPVLVTFMPAFWLLVPGAIGLIGVTEYIGNDMLAGIDNLFATVGAMVAIALGVACGYPLYRALVASSVRLGRLTPG